MISYIKEHRILLFLSFSIPLLLVALAYLANGIYWGSDISILAGDAYHQYVNLHSLYSQILHENSGFLYSWSSGLGLNLYAFSSYYMGSFFMPITFFFDVSSMPDALYLITLLKFSFIGLSAYVSFSNIYKNINPYLSLSLSISFSLMSFITSQIEIIMWLDVFILIPLILWGLDQILKGEGRVIYYVSLTILFIQNYYFGYIMAIFISLLFFVKLMSQKFSFKKLLDFICSSLLSALTSCIMLIPMYLDLKANGQSFSELTKGWTDNSWFLDLFAKNFIASYDTTQFGAVPMIYIGLFPLVLSLLFFFIRSISWKLKVGMLLVLSFIIASFYLNILDLAWQGFHSPNMFLHRYSFVFSICILLMAFETCAHLKEIKSWVFLLSPSFLTIAFIATIISKHYDYINLYMILLTLLILFAFCILFIGFKKNYLSDKIFITLFVIFGVIDMGINSYYQIYGIRDEWVFASRGHYDEKEKELSKATNYIKEDSKNSLVRTDNVNPDTANDGMKFGYNTIAQFSSIRNSNSSAVMASLGFQTDGEYLNLRYPGNTLLMDSLFSINYNINYARQPQKFGYDPFAGSSSTVTKNFYSQSIGIFVPNKYQDATLLPEDTLTNQTNFINALSQSENTFFEQLFVSKQNASGYISNQSGHITVTQENKKKTISLSYQLKIPANSQVYIHIPNLSYQNDDAQTVIISTENFSYDISTSNTGEYFNLGYYSQATTKKINLSFPQNKFVSFDMINFWRLDTTLYAKVMTDMNHNKVEVIKEKNGAQLTYESQGDGELFLTIPYDKGWSATLDGKKIDLIKAQSGFFKIKAPAGKHRLEMYFFPVGLKYGIIAFISGIL
ncbi:MAG: YfhO family protein, partial [Lactovum sp.]